LTGRLLTAVLGLLLAAAPATAKWLVVSEGTQFALAPSPDGQSLVIDLQGRLWLLPAAGGHARPLGDGLGDDRLPRYSPDGRWIVFQSYRSGRWGIWQKPAAGGVARPLLVDGYDNREPVYTPDGCCLLFSSDRSGTTDIWRLQLASGALARLTDHPADDWAPAISPDGRTLVFLSAREAQPTVMQLALDVQSAEAVPLWSAARLGPPAFSPDGQQLVLAAADSALGFPAMALWQLTLLDLADGSVRRLSAAHEDVFPFAPHWPAESTLWYSADGGIRWRDPRAVTAGEPAHPVAFTAGFRLQLSPPVPRSLPAANAVRPALGIVEPVLMPDGGGLVFAALGDLWLRNSADGALTRLSNDPHVQRDLAFSADGRKLAFISDRDGSMQVWLRELADGSERKVTQSPRGVRYPAFSADGRWLAWQQPGPRGTQDFSLHIMELASGQSRRLPAPPLWPGRMGFSADGSRLLVAAIAPGSERFREGRNSVLLIDTAGTEPPLTLKLPAGMVTDHGPALSPDGRQAALIMGGALWVSPLAADGQAAGEPVLVVNALAEYPSFTADGRTIAWLGLAGLQQLTLGDSQSGTLELALSWQEAVAAERWVLRAGRLFDGSGRWREQVDILIEGGHIVAVSDQHEHPPGRIIVDIGNDAVLPGLMDSHVHFEPHEGEWVGRALLAFGVTSVVEPGGLPFESREQMESWASGARLGPRLFFAGPQLDGSRRYFPFAAHIESRQRLEWELQRAELLGYSLLKSYTRMDNRLQQELIGEAQSRGLALSSHELWPALALGAGRVEHLRGTSRSGVSSKQSDRLRSYHDMSGLVAATGATIVPTLVVSGGFISWLLDNPAVEQNLQYAALYPEAYRRGLRGLGALAGRREPLLREGVANAAAAISELHAQGARIVAGTDAPIFPYGLSLIVELAGYQAAGLPPAAVLNTATSAAAESLGLGAELGRVAAGYRADLIIVAGDPLKDVTELLSLKAVVRNGIHYPLERLLAPAGIERVEATGQR